MTAPMTREELPDSAVTDAVRKAVEKHCHCDMRWPATARIDDFHMAEFVGELRSALLPDSAQAPLPNHVLVPLRPTPSMVSAGMGEIPEDGCEFEHVEAAYKAMVAAAPQQSPRLDLTEGQQDTLRRIANAKAAGINLHPFWQEVERQWSPIPSTDRGGK